MEERTDHMYVKQGGVLLVHTGSDLLVVHLFEAAFGCLGDTNVFKGCDFQISIFLKAQCTPRHHAPSFMPQTVRLFIIFVESDKLFL